MQIPWNFEGSIVNYPPAPARFKTHSRCGPTRPDPIPRNLIDLGQEPAEEDTRGGRGERDTRKQPGVSDKKRSRKSSAAVSNAPWDLNPDAPPGKKVTEKDVFQLFAEKVRDNKQLESRWAVLQETRVEYFRGNDFVSFLKNQTEVKEVLGPQKNIEAEDVANTLLSKNILV